jgi:hypothetical protein
MQKWEYRRVPSPDENEMDELGKKGWELVAVTTDEAGATVYAYFKRPLSDAFHGAS